MNKNWYPTGLSMTFVIQIEVKLMDGKILALCTALDPKWTDVVATPAIPAQHGTEITLTCPTDHVNEGGNKATCTNGQIVLQAGHLSPKCLSKLQ